MSNRHRTAVPACLAGALAATAWLAAGQARPAPRPQPPASAPARIGPNLVYNGDFEVVDPATQLPAGWRRHPDRPENVCLADGGPGRGKVLKLAGGAGLMGGPGVFLMQTRDIPIKPNTRYRCTGWSKSAGPTTSSAGCTCRRGRRWCGCAIGRGTTPRRRG